MNKYKELIKNTGIIAIGRLSVQILNVLLLPIYTSYMGTDDFGQADLILTYVSLFLPIVSLQIEQSLFRDLVLKRTDQQEQKKIASTIVISTFFVGILLILISFGVNSIVNIDYLNLFILLLVFNLFFNILMYYARGIGDNISYSLSSLIDMLTMIILVFLLVGVCKKSIPGMLLANLFGYIAGAIFLVIRLKIYKVIKIKSFEIKRLPGFLRYSIPMIPNSLSWWVLSASDKVIVKHFLGVSASGILAISHKFGNMYNTIFVMLQLAWQESATLHKDDDNAEEFFSNTINVSIKVLGAVGIGIVIGIPIVFKYLINSSFAASYILMPLYVISVFGGIIAGMMSGVYVAYGDSKSISITTIVGALINIVINFVLINFIGIFAAPISTIVSNAIVAAWRIIDSRKHIQLKIDYKIIALISIVLFISLSVYVNKNIYMYIILLLIDILFCVLINRKEIMYILRGIKNR